MSEVTLTDQEDNTEALRKAALKDLRGKSFSLLNCNKRKNETGKILFKIIRLRWIDLGFKLK